MHTPEQAKELWCPMARVAQAGEKDIDVAYNRAITRTVHPVKVAAVQDPADFELGASPTTEPETILTLRMSMNASIAANCLGDKCAMWRWLENRPDCKHGYCGLAGRQELAA